MRARVRLRVRVDLPRVDHEADHVRGVTQHRAAQHLVRVRVRVRVWVWVRVRVRVCIRFRVRVRVRVRFRLGALRILREVSPSRLEVST